MAPPPPGPTVLKSPGRCAKAVVARAHARENRSKNRIMSELPSEEVRVRDAFLSEIAVRVNRYFQGFRNFSENGLCFSRARLTQDLHLSGCQLQHSGCVLVVNLLQD